jgi:hypothetical protein
MTLRKTHGVQGRSAVPRLSIVIPNAVFDGSVEQTLVSVLQNRPEYSEVIVVSAQPYDDPYELGREVRFLTDTSSATRVDLINHGCRAARGDVLHLLLPGALAVDGWTDRVLHHFSDESVAAVAPILLPNSASTRALGIGVSYSASGQRRVVGVGRNRNEWQLDQSSIVAPTLLAGFFRRDTLGALQGFNRELGESLADIEVGLAFHDLGFKTVVEPQSCIVVHQSIPIAPRTLDEARCAEQLFRRQSNQSSTLRHTMLVATEFLRGLPHIRMFSRLWGRMSARREADPKPSYQARLQRARAELQQRRSAISTIRGDFGDATTSSSDRTMTTRGLRSAA